MKNLKYALVCFGVLLALTGCGKETEEDIQSTEVTTTATTTIAETDTGSDLETESESEIQTEVSTESDTKQTEVSETDAETTTEATSSETDKHSSAPASTTASQNMVTVSATEQPQAQTPAENNTPVQTDAPAQDPVSTEPPVQQDTEPVATEPPTTEASVSGDVSDLTITYQGQTLSIGDNAENFVKSVKPNFEESAPSCYGNGENINYYYDDITVYVWNENNNYMVYSIDVNAPDVAPAKGYDIGSTADFEGQKIIDCGDDCNIIIAEAGGQVINISYNKNL